MIRAVVKLSLGVLLLTALTYGAWFVPIGERTLAEHVARILETREARDLGDDLDRAGRRVRSVVESAVEHAGNARVDGGVTRR